jgi:hypothetical protein
MNTMFSRHKRSNYPNISYDAFLSAPTNMQLAVNTVEAYNGTLSPIDIGIYSTITSAQWEIIDDSGADTDITAEVQAGSSYTAFSADGDALVIQASDPFGLVSLDITAIGTGSPAYTYEYWNGSAWTALTLNNVPSLIAGRAAIVFNEPLDWAIGNDLSVGSTEMYAIKVTASTAPVGGLTFQGLSPAKTLAFNQDIPSDNRLGVRYAGQAHVLQSGEKIIGYFSTASVKNTMEASYQINP